MSPNKFSAPKLDELQISLQGHAKYNYYRAFGRWKRVGLSPYEHKVLETYIEAQPTPPLKTVEIDFCSAQVRHVTKWATHVRKKTGVAVSCWEKSIKVYSINMRCSKQEPVTTHISVNMWGYRFNTDPNRNQYWLLMCLGFRPSSNQFCHKFKWNVISNNVAIYLVCIVTDGERWCKNALLSLLHVFDARHARQTNISISKQWSLFKES